MAVSYKKLWHILIDRNMKKKDLAEQSGVSNASIAKLGRNENVNTDILLKICVALKCDISDILEIVPDEAERYGQCRIKRRTINKNNINIDIIGGRL